MVRVLPVVFVTISVLQAAWGFALYATDECTGTSLGIIGGKNSTIEEVPSAVSIRVRKDKQDLGHVCGGVIIDERFILTAAMCLGDELDTSLLTVRIGSTYLHSGGEFFEVENITVHKDYNSETIANNIALLELKKPILFGFLAKARLPEKDSDVKEGAEAIFSGWGGTKVNETETEVFHQTPIPIKAQKCCTNPDDSILNDTSKICAGSPGHDACQGDGGSPLTLDGVLIGISSYGYNNTCGVLPGIYTNVVKYVDWIDSVIDESL